MITNKFKFPFFIFIPDFVFALRDLFYSGPRAVYNTSIHSPTLTSRGSNWTLHLLHHPHCTLFWWPLPSLKVSPLTPFTKTKHFSFLLHSPAALAWSPRPHQMCLCKYLSNPCPLPPSSCWQKWVNSVTGASELELWRKTIQQGLQGVVPYWSLSVGLYCHQCVHSSMKLQATSALGRDIRVPEAMLNSAACTMVLYTQQALGRPRQVA